MLHKIFSLFNLNSDNKIEISKILIDHYIDDQSTLDKDNLISKYESSPGSIDLISLDEKKIEYLLSGMIFSDKIIHKKIKDIQVEKEILQGILYIKHFVEIEQYKRDETDSICNYFYSKKEKFKLPKNIITIKIELFEGIIEKNKQTDFVLIAETYLTI